MRPDAAEVETYLRETLHAPTSLQSWPVADTLPNYLRLYRYYVGTVGGAKVLFLHANEEPTPSIARKHEAALNNYWTGPIAFAFSTITARGRQRLVSAGIAFVVPRSQVYLPMLGMNLLAKYRQHAPNAERLRPSAQVLLLHLLLGHRMVDNTPSAAAELLGYTAMAMGQALDQLDAMGLLEVRRVGRNRRFELLGNPRETWERAQPFLASPVKTRQLVFGDIVEIDHYPVAGLSALSRYSMLAEPGVPVVAVHGGEAGFIDTSVLAAETRDDEEARAEVEIWSYSPQLLSQESTVDRLSLYLSLRDDADERVQAALEEMMEAAPWSEG